ncbi:AcrR family transcriptional regulator [Novosphingobium chloroacetimidivorans]|uniref:AcrR family transcriptional regulator n=1 Tax=Novosphingobium chloroacetimidivorans TaxID=1428314 RepID=A0A7W7KCY4_9SPHN|nr:TetR/AcrR family transcriptional regulator [Novosphingobium chloroacetimidivorans]MBB4860146.1 AcrR family transcriptional regulator [Novosphingobium chloroacetimidivorans]
MARAATAARQQEPAFPPPLAVAVAVSCEAVSHNLAGQKLGRKGRVTRERILAAALELIENNEDEAFTLSGVARRAGLGMSSLYNYFSDQIELLLAVLEPVMATAEAAYLAQARDRWLDEELADRTQAFVRAYHEFWARHSGLLHLRNSLADQLDVRMMLHRINSTRPLIGLIVRQMSDQGREPGSPEISMATVLMTGIERSITLSTDKRLPKLTGLPFDRDEERYLSCSARLLEMAIRDMRGKSA